MITDDLRIKPATDIAVLIEQLVQEVIATPCYDRRSEPRYAVDLPAEVCTLDDTFHPNGPRFEARVKDISASGIRVVHSDVVSSGFLYVLVQRGNGENVEFVMKVLWSRRYGHVYATGGKFVTS